MKLSYILVGVLVLVGAYFLFFAGGNDAENQAASAPEAALPLDETTNEAEEMNDMDEMESESDEVEAQDASDAGMEFPTTDDTEGPEKSFTLDSFNFGYSQEEIRVQEGDTVTITLTNSGGLHDWVLDEFSAATERIGEGDTTTVTFVADKAGTYEYYCSVGNHRDRGMTGTLVVE